MGSCWRVLFLAVVILSWGKAWSQGSNISISIFPPMSHNGGFVQVQCTGEVDWLELEGERVSEDDTRLRTMQTEGVTVFSIIPVTLLDNQTMARCGRTDLDGVEVISQNATIRVDDSFPPTCPGGQSSCLTTPLCLNNSQFCDGVPNCPDGNDEAYCNSCSTLETGFLYSCGEEQVCLDRSRFCDGVRDCSSDDSDEIDYCILIRDCGPLSSPSNGIVSFESTTVGSVARYSCDEGLVLVGGEERICLSDGQWFSTEPSCTAIDCGPLASASNGMVSFESTTVGSIARYSCDEGLVLVGGGERTCGSNGLWSIPEPICRDSPGTTGMASSSTATAISVGVTVTFIVISVLSIVYC